MAIYRAPRARTVNGKRIISARARAEIERIEQLLSGAERGPIGDEALAERDRIWAQQQGRAEPQCDLPLGNPGSHDQH